MNQTNRNPSAFDNDMELNNSQMNQTNQQNSFVSGNGMELNNGQMNQTNQQNQIWPTPEQERGINYQQFNGQVNDINPNVMDGNGDYLPNSLPNDTLNINYGQLNQQNKLKQPNKKQSKKKQPKKKQSKKKQSKNNPLNQKQQKAIKKRQIKTKLQKRSTHSVINIKEIDENDHGNDTPEPNIQIDNEEVNNNENVFILYKEKSQKRGIVTFDINVFLDNINKLEVYIYSKTTNEPLYDDEYKPVIKEESVTVVFPTNTQQEKYICLYLYNNEDKIEHQLRFELRDEKWLQRKKKLDKNFNYDETYTFNEKKYKIHFN